MKKDDLSAVAHRSGRRGVCVVYDRAGRELWRDDAFVLGVSVVPRRLSMSMGAMRVVDAGSGERLAQWNPWGVL